MKEMKIEEGSESEQKEQLRKKLIVLFEEMRVKNKFNGLERLKDIIITNEDWQNNGLLTTTMKKKRHAF